MPAFNLRRFLVDHGFGSAQLHPASLPPEPLALLAFLSDSATEATLCQVAGQVGWQLIVTHSRQETIAALRRKLIPIVICERNCCHDWRLMIRLLAQSSSNPVVILVSAVVDQYLLQEVVENKGYDVIRKPLDSDELLRTVHLGWLYWKNRPRKS